VTFLHFELRITELCLYLWTIWVEQSSGCSMEMVRWHYTLSSDNSRPICSTSNVLTNKRNIHHRPELLWRFLWFWRRIQHCQPAYLLTLVQSVLWYLSVHLLCLVTECSIDLSSIVSLSRQCRHLSLLTAYPW